MGHWNLVPYEQRTDIEKIQSQWTKLSGHQNRTDWSAAVVRAATACEVAVNLAIRREHVSCDGQINTEVVNAKLIRANGLKGKIQKLLLPLIKEKPHSEPIRKLKKLALTINEKRNLIVHSGEFCGRADAIDLIEQCQQFVVGLVNIYEPGFILREASGRAKRSG